MFGPKIWFYFTFCLYPQIISTNIWDLFREEWSLVVCHPWWKTILKTKTEWLIRIILFLSIHLILLISNFDWLEEEELHKALFLDVWKKCRNMPRKGGCTKYWTRMFELISKNGCLKFKTLKYWKNYEKSPGFRVPPIIQTIQNHVIISRILFVKSSV